MMIYGAGHHRSTPEGEHDPTCPLCQASTRGSLAIWRNGLETRGLGRVLALQADGGDLFVRFTDGSSASYSHVTRFTLTDR
jgi:hypothetical protein